ncbi:MAG: AraC family transcriptional regulator [Agathobacter sp.]|nr:AraC family transcriptional regulator [Agathobacter sp.]
MAKKKKETVEFRFYELPQGESALVLCGDSWIRPYGHDETNLHFHNLLEIGICREGAGDMVLDEETHRYQTNSITVIPENFPHITISDGGGTNFWEYVFIDLRGMIETMFPGNVAFQNEAMESLSKGALITSAQEKPFLARIIDAIIEETKAHRLYAQRTISLLVQQIVIELLRNDSSIREGQDEAVKGTNMAQIASALDYINKNYQEPMKASQLAELCNMSETHFRRVFEEYINMPPMEYVNLIRVQKACELMKKSNISMEHVAIKCGFTTPSTFNRNFRKFVGTSPYQWKINPENYAHKLLNFRISALKGW